MSLLITIEKERESGWRNCVVFFKDMQRYCHISVYEIFKELKRLNKKGKKK